MIRLVPFLVIVVVPFMEFTLPFLLKLFPNMLPSTYTSASQKASNHNAALKVRLEMARFLKAATTRMIDEESRKELTGESAVEFLKRASQGKPVSNAEIIKVGKALKEELTLDKISHLELQALAQFFDINKFGPRSYLQYQLHRKLRKLQEDDALIAAEGIDKLSNEELVQACFLRGMKVEGRTRAQMEKQLEDWMELADSEEVPPFLLLLSRSFDTSPDESQVAKEAIDRLAKDPRVEQILERLPDDADLMERKIQEQKAEQESSDLSILFKAVDKDGDGRISVEELKEMLRRLDVVVPEAEVEDALSRVDADKDGRIAFSEFIDVMRENEQKGMGEALAKELQRMKKEVAQLKEKEKMAPEVVSSTTRITEKIDSMMEAINKDIEAEKAKVAAAAATVKPKEEPTTSQLLKAMENDGKVGATKKKD